MDPITIALTSRSSRPRSFGSSAPARSRSPWPIRWCRSPRRHRQGHAGGGARRDARDAELAQQFNLAVLAADTKLEELYLADRKDARARDVEVRKLDGGKNRRADIMLVCAFLAVIAIAALLALGKVSGGDAVAASSSPWAACSPATSARAFDFEFGSSRGSRDKDELLAKNRRPVTTAQRARAARLPVCTFLAPVAPISNSTRSACSVTRCV
jgi:hypothetical protein